MDSQIKHQRILNHKKDSDYLIKILNEWDFLGISRINPEINNEYNCLLDPILNSLYSQATKEEMNNIISLSISNHFGVMITSKELNPLIEKVYGWWNNRN